jgi:hypothetical protein
VDDRQAVPRIGHPVHLASRKYRLARQPALTRVDVLEGDPNGGRELEVCCVRTDRAESRVPFSTLANAARLSAG